eukprot:SAG31_NODE_41370_length_276_cov_0.875706_1_plen_58_part_10
MCKKLACTRLARCFALAKLSHNFAGLSWGTRARTVDAEITTGPPRGAYVSKVHLDKMF